MPRIVVVLAALLACGPLAVAADKASEPGVITLFDGTNLDRWTMGPARSWVVEDGTIALKRAFDGKEHNADYLWTKDTFGDFVLELEFKVPEQANSGVFLRTADLQNPVYTGLEIQIVNSHGKQSLSRVSTAGALYDCQTPTQNTVRAAGQWNQMRITCRGARVEVELNGELITHANLDRWTKPKKNPDGTPNKFPRAMREFARRGHIGLQDHGRAVWYRNIRVKPL